MYVIIKNTVRPLLLITLLSLLAACTGTHKLAGTPNVLKVPVAAERSSDVGSSAVGPSQAKIFFVTDRSQTKDKNNEVKFGTGRSDAMSMGFAQVTSEPSRSGKSEKIKVEVSEPTILVEFPATPLPLVKTDKGIAVREDARLDYEESVTLMKEALIQHMQENSQREVVLFVHGFNNGFNDAIYSLNDIWHYTEKNALPMIYTWPAGAGRGLLSYFTDREAGEFSIFHLKETLRILASIEQVEKIHIIAHSRGTDVTTTALRELVIEARGKYKDAAKVRETLKVQNLVMAAPDIDYGIVKQRLIAEKFGTAFGQITIYMNIGDSALRLSQILLKGVRFGRLLATQQGRSEVEIFEAIDNVAFINVEDVAGFLGHGYFHRHPGVMSDIIVVMEKNSIPGSKDRPLVHDRSNFWQLKNGYLIGGDQAGEVLPHTDSTIAE